MNSEIVKVAKESASDVGYILAGAFLTSYLEGFISKYIGFKYNEEVMAAVSLAGAIYFKNKMLKNVFKGALVSSFLGLAKKYFNLGVL